MAFSERVQVASRQGARGRLERARVRKGPKQVGAVQDIRDASGLADRERDMQVLDTGFVPACGIAFTLVEVEEKLKAAGARDKDDGVEASRARRCADAFRHEREGVSCASSVGAGELEYSLEGF